MPTKHARHTTKELLPPNREAFDHDRRTFVQGENANERRSRRRWEVAIVVLGLNAMAALGVARDSLGACLSDLECLDGNACNGVEVCNLLSGSCEPGTPLSDGAPCDDGDFCTAVDTCQGGVCIGPANTTWNVPVAGACNGGDPNCLTIQDAVTAAAPGDVIVVAAGSFPENVTIHQALTLRGAQAGVNACTRSAVPLSSETVLNPANTLTRFNLNAACITIDGFTTIGGSGVQTGSPIASASAQIDRNKILNNRVLEWTGSGVWFNRGGVNVTVNGNFVDSTLKVGSGATFFLNGPQSFLGLQVTDNCLVWNGAAGTYDPATGLFVDGNHNVAPSLGVDARTPAISGNRIDRHATGANLGSRSFTGGTISNNEFTNSDFDGLQGGIQLSSITGNRFDGNGRSGLALTSFGNTGADRGAQNSTITLNCFTNNGLRRHNGGLLFSTSQGTGLISTNHANNNSFSGNYRGAIYGNTCSNTGASCSSNADCSVCSGGTNSGLPCGSAADCPLGSCPAPAGTCGTTAIGGTETIDAENNFWGSLSGPNSPPQNPSGTGDRVDTPNSLGGLIDVLPFSTSTALDCPCTPAACDDGNPCTDESCDAMDACVYTPNTNSCDDGFFCTSNDACLNGTCGGGPRDCATTTTVAVDFESPAYTPGSIHGQDGWVSAAACAPYDHAVGGSFGTAGFGSQSLRISNAVTSGCFDGTFSKALPNEVGEKTADNGGVSGGTRLGHFEAEWSFASTVPGAEQPGLSVVASPDQGNGARMSWVQMADTPAGLDVNFFDYQDVAPYGSDSNHADGCGTGDDFVFTPVATGLSRTAPHTIRITLDTYEGPRNDVVKVYVDGVLGHTGTSWEDYFRWCDESLPSGVSRTIDSVMFRTGGTAAPATAGQGFVIDNLTLRSGLTTDACTIAVCDENVDMCVVNPANEGGTCNDENACTTGDVCSGGICAGTDTSVFDCDDGNACTEDSCDPMLGCQYINNTDPCDDGNACTLGDACRDGVCICPSFAGTITTQVDIYLDLEAGLANDTRFDYSSAINGVPVPDTTTCSHRRDIVFNCGYYDDSDVTGSGPRFVCATGFNAGRSAAYPKDPGHAPQAITASGWYTFRHLFKAVGNGLVIDLDILPVGSAIPVASWSLPSPGDIVFGPGANVGGSRYGWIASNELPFLALDNTNNTSTEYNQGFETNNSGWDVLGGQYDAIRVSSGTNGVSSAAGSFHGEAEQADLDSDGGSAFTDWGSDRNLRCTFPTESCPTPVCNDKNDCTADSCNPLKGCVYTPNSNLCEDGLFCTVDDTCVAGVCTGGGPRDCSATDVLLVDFESPSYSLGSIHAQDGWSSLGSAGSGCAVYDHEVASNTFGYASFGGQSLRMSNAVTSGCFGDHTFSKSLPNEVGEKTATNLGMSGGMRRTHFEADWSFASTVPGAEQPGLSVVASPDRGDGARMGWVQMLDTPTGLEVNFFDYQDIAPFGSVGVESAGCDVGDNFFFTTVATGLDRMVPHTVKVVLDTYEGPRNDVVLVYVDGVLLHTGTSWEDYFRWCEGDGVSRTVDSILFRTAGAAAPATNGNGFVIDNLTLRSGFALEQCLAGVCEETTDSCVLAPANEGGTCDDGDACSNSDVCMNGSCVPGSQLVCDDMNACTDDTCDPLTGCVYTPDDTNSCDDGDECTINDMCNGGSCMGTFHCVLYGDVTPPGGDCLVDLNDVLCILDGYAKMFSCPQGDIWPCGGGDGLIELGDVLAVLAAYSDIYECPNPCPP